MSVYISLEAAIAAAMRADDNGVSLEDAKKMSRAVVAELESLPAADVRPVVRGKWVWDGDTLDWEKRYFCNRCEWKTYKRSDYCPSCGADMREENHDNQR